MSPISPPENPRIWLEAIFLAPAAGVPLQRVAEAWAEVKRGLRGDRYAEGTGYYSRRDACEVTLIEGEALDRMTGRHRVAVQHGEHRRNLVTRGVALRELEGKQLRIGEALLEYERPRPPCGYMERITERGMTRALGEGAGICARVIRGGRIREGDLIEILAVAGAKAPRVLP